MKRRKPIARIPYEHMSWVWISDYYDVPLFGLCRYGGELCEFRGGEWFPPKKIKRYKIYKINLAQKLRWLMEKRVFELMIGEHWSSYPERKPSKQKNRLLFKLYYLPFTIKWKLRNIRRI